jgi:hypothetical protein
MMPIASAVKTKIASTYVISANAGDGVSFRLFSKRRSNALEGRALALKGITNRWGYLCSPSIAVNCFRISGALRTGVMGECGMDQFL